MEIFGVIWNQYLYIPLFNFLIWLYLNHSGFNLGVAVIILTVLLRVVLLPFTILDEKGKLTWMKIEGKLAQLNKDFAKDPVRRKAAVRLLLKQHHIRPWAKAVVMTVQLLMLILLYQVFIDGISATKLHQLYPSITPPDFITTTLFWFDIGKPNLLLAAIASGYFFAEILIKRMGEARGLSRSEALYIFLFPSALFAILAWLPSVKSLFILTSLLVSTIISAVTALIKIGIRQRMLAKRAEQST